MASPEFAIAVVLGLFIVQIIANVRRQPKNSRQETVID